MPLPLDQPNARTVMKPPTWNRGHDNVLLGKSYRTPRGALIDEYGAVMVWRLGRETVKLGEKPGIVPLDPPWIRVVVTPTWSRVSFHNHWPSFTGIILVTCVCLSVYLMTRTEISVSWQQMTCFRAAKCYFSTLYSLDYCRQHYT